MDETNTNFQSFLIKLEKFKYEEVNIEKEHVIFISAEDKILLGNQRACLDVNIILFFFPFFCFKTLSKLQKRYHFT